MIFGAGITSAAATLDAGSIVYTVVNLFLAEIDGAATIARLRERIEVIIVAVASTARSLGEFSSAASEV